MISTLLRCCPSHRARGFGQLFEAAQLCTFWPLRSSSSSNVHLSNAHLSQRNLQHQSSPRGHSATDGPPTVTSGPEGLRQSKELNKAIVNSGRDDESLGKLLSIVEARVDEFSSVNIATALTILSRSRQFRKGAGRTETGPKGETKGLQSLHQHRLSEATRLLAGHISRNVHIYEAQALANCSGALVKLRAPNEPVLPAIEWRAVGIIRDFTAQNLSNIAWAFAKARQPAPRLFGAIQEQALSKLGEFSSQNLSNTVWAFATAQHPAPVLFRAVASEATSRIDEFSPQGLANTLWAFAAADEASANSRLSAPLVLEAQRAALSHGLHSFSNQGLANLVWGVSKAASSGGSSSPLLPSSHQDGFFLSVADELKARLPALRDAELAMAAVAFREARFRHPPLLRPLCLEASRRSRTSDASSLANVAKAAAMLSAPGLDRLMRGIRARATRDPGSFGVLELCNVAYSMALSGSLDRPFTNAAFQSIARRSEWVDDPSSSSSSSGSNKKQQQHLSTASCCALFQCLMALELQSEAPSSSSSSSSSPSPLLTDDAAHGAAETSIILPEGLREHLERTWRATASKTTESSTQKAVLRAIKRTGMRFYAEAETSDGLFSVDAMVFVDEEPAAAADDDGRTDEGKSSSRAVAVEVDGPSHYSSNPPFRELAHTLLRRRLLGPRVDAVVSVPFYEWDELEGIPSAEEEYIERKIRTALLQ